MKRCVSATPIFTANREITGSHSPHKLRVFLSGTGDVKASESMRNATVSMLAILVLTALPSIGFTQGNPPRTFAPGVALGVRTVGRFGDYTYGGLGGQLTVRVGSLVSLQLFSDHMVGTHNGMFQHNHEVGSTLQLRVLRGERWAVFPMIGACANLAITHAPNAREPSVKEIQFGLRAGVGAELAVSGGFSLGTEVLAIAYLGHPMDTWGSSIEASPDLAVFGTGQLVLHADYHF
jgi:hypothetical protein